MLPKREHKGEAEDLVSFVHGGGVGFFWGSFFCLFVLVFKETGKKKSVSRCISGESVPGSVAEADS